MKILIISQYHPPEMGAAASRWSDYAIILSRQGHSVTVIAEIPNYPSGIVPQRYKKKWFVKEQDPTNTYSIIRTAVWANSRKTNIQRIGFYLSFMFSSALIGLKLRRSDLIIVSSPPLFVGLSGVVISRLKKTPMIFDIRDLWPESAKVLGEITSGIILNFAERMEKTIYKHSSGYLLAVPGFSNYLTKEYPFTLFKGFTNLMNGVSQSFFENVVNIDIHENKFFTVLYSGNIGLAQELKVVILSAILLKDYPINFQIIGDGVQRKTLEKMTADHLLKNVKFIDPMPRKELITYIKSASVCLVPLKKSPLFLNAIPSKLLEYMACGKPVIVGIRGEVENLVKKSDAGLCIEPEEERALSEAIITYYQNKNLRVYQGENGQKYIKQHYVKENLMENAMIEIKKILK
ncbi:MAG: glycosyltransferase family 4 protein [Candidatus Marinimicrobia bacterium]|nr:glycosyltransferase family 4 protein [Candidatus Neomarinimicrobiota bacterium]